MNRFIVLCLVSAIAAGCKGKSDAEPPPLPSTAAAPAVSAAAPAAAPAAVAGSPTPEDYEQQAIDEINPQNIDTELDKLEKEIGQ
ncbi:MAG TPA: hypothetical protein VHE30_02030 [Polyangiaceae bacterium]|nr:hypothetical protein [Polyangiaceae bacterium]